MKIDNNRTGLESLGTVRTDGAAMGRMLREIEKTYSRRFNERAGFSGALFEGRFGSVWLPDERALAYVTRYIHANCRDMGVDPEDYRWSTIWAYLGRADEPEWLETGRVLGYVGGRAAYRRYLANRLAENACRLLSPIL